MENINIKNLFNCETNNTVSKIVDIKTIARIEKPFNINKLIATREKKGGYY